MGVGAHLLPLAAHLLVDERGEVNHRELAENGIPFDELCEVVSVHLGHLDIGNHTADMVGDGVVVGLGFHQEIPGLLAVVGNDQILVPGFPQGFGDHPGKEHGILRQEDGLFAALPGPHFVDVLHLNAQVGADFGDDFLKVQNRDKVVFKVRDAGSHALPASVDDAVRLFDLLPGDAGDAHHTVDMEGKIVVIEVGDDEDIPLRVGGGGQPQVAGQVDDGDDHITGLEDSLDIRLGLLHGLDRAGHHDFQDLGNVDTEGLPRNGEFHDLQFVGAGFQQNLGLSFHLHDSQPPFHFAVDFYVSLCQTAQRHKDSYT